MSNKEIVMDLVQRLPAEATLTEIAREIEFVAGVRRTRVPAWLPRGVEIGVMIAIMVAPVGQPVNAAIVTPTGCHRWPCHGGCRAQP